MKFEKVNLSGVATINIAVTCTELDGELPNTKAISLWHTSSEFQFVVREIGSIISLYEE